MSRFEDTEREIRYQKALETLQKMKDGATVEIPIEHINLNANVRTGIKKDEPEFRQLVESIQEVGLLQYPVVSVNANGITCVTGHRRIEALKYLKQKKVKCMVRKLSKEKTKKIVQLIENTARKNLAPLDLAHTVASIKMENSYPASKLASLLGKERKYIERLVKIDKWPEEIKCFVREHEKIFTLKKLFLIAQRNLSQEQILEEVQINAGLKKRTPKCNINPKKHKKMIDFFEQRKLDNNQRKLIEDFLREMKISGWVSFS